MDLYKNLDIKQHEQFYNTALAKKRTMHDNKFLRHLYENICVEYAEENEDSSDDFGVHFARGMSEGFLLALYLLEVEKGEKH